MVFELEKTQCSSEFEESFAVLSTFVFFIIDLQRNQFEMTSIGVATQLGGNGFSTVGATDVVSKQDDEHMKLWSDQSDSTIITPPTHDTKSFFIHRDALFTRADGSVFQPYYVNVSYPSRDLLKEFSDGKLRTATITLYCLNDNQQAVVLNSRGEVPPELSSYEQHRVIEWSGAGQESHDGWTTFTYSFPSELVGGTRSSRYNIEVIRDRGQCTEYDLSAETSSS